MSALSPRGRALIEAVREVDRPTTQDRARIRAALTAQLGVAVLPAVSSSLAAPQAAAPPASIPVAPPTPVAPLPVLPPPLPAIPMLSGLGVKIVAAGALISAVGIGAGVISSRPSGPAITATERPTALEAKARQPVADESRSPPPAPVTAAEESAAPSTSPLAEPAGEASSSDPPANARRAESAAKGKPSSPRAQIPAVRPAAPPALAVAPPLGGVSPSHASSLMEETALLREAQEALKEGDAAKSLAAVDALAARHPQGMLREERLAARVLALCASGRVEEARAEGQRFVAEMPRSIQAERVRASCAFSSGYGR
jgi:hypothetical protein